MRELKEEDSNNKQERFKLQDNYVSFEENKKKEIKKDIDEMEEVLIEGQSAALMLFYSKFGAFIDNFRKVFDGNSSKSEASETGTILPLILSYEHLSLIQPYMHFLSTHNMKFIDNVLTKIAKSEKPPTQIVRTDSQDFIKLYTEMGGLIKRIYFRKKYQEKLDREELLEDLAWITEKSMKKIAFQNSQIKFSNERKETQQIEYEAKIRRKYSKVIQGEACEGGNKSEEKIRQQEINLSACLKSRRDPFGRTFFLKKEKLSVWKEKKNNLQKEGGESKIGFASEEEKDSIPLALLNKNNEALIPPLLIGVSERETNSLEVIEKPQTVFSVGLVTTDGNFLGTLSITSFCLKYYFNESSKPKYSNKFFVIKQRKLIFCKDIVEIYMRHYHHQKQAAEIYYNGGAKSILFDFLNPISLSSFAKTLQNLLINHSSSLHYHIILSPEQTFTTLNITSQWVNSNISNFQYLAILNKFANRSYHDLAQFPIFPWVIQDFESEKLDLTKPASYRTLSSPIAAISPTQRLAADTRLNDMIARNESSQFQFNCHYLPPAAPISYLLRVGPFMHWYHLYKESLLQTINDKWQAACQGTFENYELIPEYYYFVEALKNHISSEQIIEYEAIDEESEEDDKKEVFNMKATPEKEEPINLKLTRAVSSQKKSSHSESKNYGNILLPLWANSSPHLFIYFSYLALESPHTSYNLDAWIDLIYGEKQQERGAYNLFRDLCDGKIMSQEKCAKMSEKEIEEIHDFGINPRKLFNEKHPVKSKDNMIKKTQCCIFNAEQYNAIRKYALIKVQTYSPNAVIFIGSLENKVYVVINGMKLFQSREDYINAPHERSVIMEKKEIQLTHNRGLLTESHHSINSESGKNIAHYMNSSGEYIITCQHYDCSFKIHDLNRGGDVIWNNYFHKVEFFNNARIFV